MYNTGRIKMSELRIAEQMYHQSKGREGYNSFYQKSVKRVIDIFLFTHTFKCFKVFIPI